jgi:hypothetical protein
LGDGEFKQAIKENRVLTIHHTDNAGALADYGQPGNGTINVVERFMFLRPLPSTLGTVIGIKWDLLK